jgi:hypothetical protein
MQHHQGRHICAHGAQRRQDLRQGIHAAGRGTDDDGLDGSATQAGSWTACSQLPFFWKMRSSRTTRRRPGMRGEAQRLLRTQAQEALAHQRFAEQAQGAFLQLRLK